jgi:hypothetical protein
VQFLHRVLYSEHYKQADLRAEDGSRFYGDKAPLVGPPLSLVATIPVHYSSELLQIVVFVSILY